MFEYRADQAAIGAGQHATRVTFSSPLPDASYRVSLVPIQSDSSGWTVDDTCHYLTVVSKTSVGFVIDVRTCDGSHGEQPVPTTLYVDWIALPSR
ncbi:MAG: hypothetical protein U0893_10550 [Chloroflexota bacterium]